MGKTLYILQSLKHGRYYTGSTDNLERRIMEHNAGQTKSTRAGLPWEILYSHDFKDSSIGLYYERRIKSLKSRKVISGLIDGSININDL
jgi:putative endonuclease